MALLDALRDPIELPPNRIARFYRGGRMLDTFRGGATPSDDDRPEDWVGSATRTWTPPGDTPSELGLSRVRIGGEVLSLDAILAREPEALVGSALFERAGRTTGLLVKLLDAAERLPVHCHPTRDAAARLLGSSFGKTEAWIILGTREPEGRIWAGFREPVQRETLRSWIDEQRTDDMLDALISHPVRAGDAFLIPAGTPHAIGAGVFLLELQEPTDFSVVAEMRGFPISGADASLGLGWNRAIDFFATDAAGDLRQTPIPVGRDVTSLLGAAAEPYFRALRIELDNDGTLPLEPEFAVGVVIAGSGELHGVARSIALAPGTTFAVPAAAVAGLRVTCERLELLVCLPPAPAALDAKPLPRSLSRP